MWEPPEIPDLVFSTFILTDLMVHLRGRKTFRNVCATGTTAVFLAAATALDLGPPKRFPQPSRRGLLCILNQICFVEVKKSFLAGRALSGGNLLINKKTFLARAQRARVARPDAKTKLDSIAQGRQVLCHQRGSV